MDIPSNLLSSLITNLGMGIYVLILLAALITAPWYKIRDNESLHVFLGACVCLLMLWTLRAGIQPGLNFHIIGVTALCLMFGWQFAFIAISLVMVGHTFNEGLGWSSYALNVVIMGGIPIIITTTVLQLAQRYLPHNYFIYIFLNSFITAGLSSLAVALFSYGLYRYTGTYSLNILNQQFLPFMLLIALPESTINGITMIGMVIYRPGWVSTFHDHLYLDKK